MLGEENEGIAIRSRVVEQLRPTLLVFRTLLVEVEVNVTGELFALLEYAVNVSQQCIDAG